jgi:hypothetical protein
MEMGQALFGNPVSEYSCPDWVTALIKDMLDDLEMHHGNYHQHTADYFNENPFLDVCCRWEDTYFYEVGGITFRRYYWGDDEVEAEKPNFSFGEVEIRWYKYPGRGMTTNVKWKKPHLWVGWFERFAKELRLNTPRGS